MTARRVCSDYGLFADVQRGRQSPLVVRAREDGRRVGWEVVEDEDLDGC